MVVDYSKAQARLEFFAEVLEKEPPICLLAADGGPSDELLSFCKGTGMSLDWVFLGDLRPMVLATYRHRSGELADAD